MTNPSAIDEIQGLAEDNQYVVFGDTNHGEAGVEAFALGREVMGALAAGGVKHMMLEGIPSGVATYINAYVDGEIDREQLQSIVNQQISSSKGSGGVVFASAEDSRNQVMTLADNAREFDMKVHALNYGEGLIDKPIAEAKNKLEMMVAERVVDEMKATGGDFDAVDVEAIRAEVEAENPELEALASKVFSSNLSNSTDYMNEAEGWIEDNPDEVQALMEQYGLSQEELQNNLVQNIWMRERIRQDPAVAERIENFANDEKAAIVYGAAHLAYRKGDIDHSLGEKDTVTIFIHADKSQSVDMSKVLPPIALRSFFEVIRGASHFEDADYDVDLATGKMTDSKGRVIAELEDTSAETVVDFSDDDLSYDGDDSLGRDVLESVREDGKEVTPDVAPREPDPVVHNVPEQSLPQP